MATLEVGPSEEEEARVACLIRPTGPSETSELEVCEEGVAVLESLGEVTVVAVAGQYRTGKSFFLNRLVKRGTFGVGETTEPCTRGIWLWHSPALKAADGSALVLVDTEGLASADRDETYDAKIFALSLLLSSYFILNVVGVIDDATVERLHLVSQVSKRIARAADETPLFDDGGDDHDHSTTPPTEKKGASSSSSSQEEERKTLCFPPLVVLVRDFALKATTKEGNVEISDSAYLEESLRERGKPNGRAARRDAVRRSLKSLFPTRACATLVRPCHDEADLRAAATLPDDHLRPEFLAKVQLLRDGILHKGSSSSSEFPTASKKRVCGTACKGPALALLAKSHVDAVNRGAAPNVRTAWDAAAKEISLKAQEDAAEAYRAALPAWWFSSSSSASWGGAAADDDDENDDKTLGLLDVAERHAEAARRAMGLYEARAVEGHEETAVHREKLGAFLDAERTRLLRDLSARSKAASREAADLFVAKHRRATERLDADAEVARVVAAAVDGFDSEKFAAVLVGPRRGEVALEDILAKPARVLRPLLVDPAVDAALGLCADRAAKERDRYESEAAHRRSVLAETEARLKDSLSRADHETVRADTNGDKVRDARAEVEALQDDLRHRRQEIDDLRRREERLADLFDASRAASAANDATATETARQDARQRRDLEAALERAILALETEREAFLTSKRDADEKTETRLAERAEKSRLDCDAAVAREVANACVAANDATTQDILARTAAAMSLGRAVAAVEALHKRAKDEKRRLHERDRAVRDARRRLHATTQQDLSPTVHRFVRPLGQLFSAGQERVEQVAQSFLQKIDAELLEDDDGQD